MKLKASELLQKSIMTIVENFFQYSFPPTEKEYEVYNSIRDGKKSPRQIAKALNLQFEDFIVLVQSEMVHNGYYD